MSKDNDMFASWRKLPDAERAVRLERVRQDLNEAWKKAGPEDSSGMLLCEFLVSFAELEAMSEEEFEHLLDEDDAAREAELGKSHDAHRGPGPGKREEAPASLRSLMRFDRYVALGDSISIDEYPGLDWQELHRLSAPAPGLGAAALLHRNNDEAWPEFRETDLHALSSGTRFDSLVVDGGTTLDVLTHQLPRLEEGDTGPTLITLTVGGNDLLQLLASGKPPAPGDADLILQGIDDILDRLEQLFPHRTVLLGTVYDPSDGGSFLMGLPLGPNERAVLERLNSGIRRLASERDQVVLADIQAHFAGHGLAAPSSERWYWPHMIIEPSARGASEVRRVWLRALAAASQD